MLRYSKLLLAWVTFSIEDRFYVILQVFSSNLPTCVDSPQDVKLAQMLCLAVKICYEVFGDFLVVLDLHQ